MITDVLTQFSGGYSGGVATGQTVTGTDASVLSTNTYDLGVARDIGKGEPLDVAVHVVTAAAGGTSVRFQVIQADDAALTSNVQVIVQTADIPVATLVAGASIPLTIDRVEPFGAKRYLGMRYVTVGAVSAGAYWAAITHDISDRQVNYPGGYTVL
jgi:predicted RecA/RadA family phage recombinase